MDLLHSLHERFRRLQHALAGGSDLLQNLLLVYEHVHLVLDALRHGLTQRFGFLGETLGGRAQLFGAVPGILGLLAQEFGGLPLDFLVLAPLFMRSNLYTTFSRCCSAARRCCSAASRSCSAVWRISSLTWRWASAACGPFP